MFRLSEIVKNMVTGKGQAAVASMKSIMKPARRMQVETPSTFSILDHLLVQREIEKPAYALWQARGGNASNGLSDWLRAECEVVTRFCQAYAEGLAQLDRKQRCRSRRPSERRLPADAFVEFRNSGWA